MAIVVGCGVWSSVRAATPPETILTDDRGRGLPIAPGAKRIVSLAPHLSEIVVALGAVARLVAVDPHSDASEIPSNLPRIAAYPQPDPERLLAVSPDLVLLWGEGLSPTMLARLEQAGLRVFVSQPRSLEAIAQSLERLGMLLDVSEKAKEQAREFRTKVDHIASRYARRDPLPVFVQIWELPLITIGAGTVMADALLRCGVRNVADTLIGSAPRLSPEHVITLRPALIISTLSQSSDLRWRRLGVVSDSAHSARFLQFNESAIERPSPKILQSLERLCALIDSHRPAHVALPSGR